MWQCSSIKCLTLLFCFLFSCVSCSWERPHSSSIVLFANVQLFQINHSDQFSAKCFLGLYLSHNCHIIFELNLEMRIKIFFCYCFVNSLPIIFAEKFNNQLFTTEAELCDLFSHSIAYIHIHSMTPSVIIYTIININLCNIVLISTSA